MTANEKLIDLEFPTAGVSLLQEVQEQPPGTTIVGENVRATNPDGLRARGGTRAGLIRYCANQVPSGAGLIQHLNVIVDPTTERLPQNFLVPDETWVEDPLNPGTFVPPGGWGVPPNPNANPPVPEADIDFEQADIEGFDTAAGEQTFNFSTSVGSNSQVLAVVVTNSVTTNLTVTVQNGSLHAFTQVGSYERRTKLGLEFTISLWRRKAVDGAGDQSIKVTSSDPAPETVDIVVGGVVLSGVNVTSPLDDTSQSQGNTDPMNTGSIGVTADGGAIVAAFAGILAPDTVTYGGSLVAAAEHGDGTLDSTDIQLYIAYRLNLAAGASLNASAQYDGGADDFVAIGASFND